MGTAEEESEARQQLLVKSIQQALYAIDEEHGPFFAQDILAALGFLASVQLGQVFDQAPDELEAHKMFLGSRIKLAVDTYIKRSTGEPVADSAESTLTRIIQRLRQTTKTINDPKG